MATQSYIGVLGALLLIAPAQAQTARQLQSSDVTTALGFTPQGALGFTPLAPSGSFTAGDLLVAGPSTGQIQDASSVFNGTSQHIFNTWPPAVGTALSYGTAGSPITTAGPIFKISRTEQVASATCGSNAVDSECNAALAVYNIGTASDGMQTAAIFAGAQSGSTHDNVGISSIGRTTGGGTGIGTGAYLEGRRDTNTGSNLGAEVRSNNQTASAQSYTSSAFNNGSLWLSASGTARNQCGACVGNAGQAFDVGFAATATSVVTTTFRDDSSSTTSIQINGSHTNQIVGTGFSFDGSGNASVNTYGFSATVASCAGNAVQLGGTNNIWFCTNSAHIATVTTFGITANSFAVSANNNPGNGINLVVANSVGFFSNSSEAFRITSTQQIQYTAVTTGTPTASLCLDASNNIIKKTTAGSCI